MTIVTILVQESWGCKAVAYCLSTKQKFNLKSQLNMEWHPKSDNANETVAKSIQETYNINWKTLFKELGKKWLNT